MIAIRKKIKVHETKDATILVVEDNAAYANVYKRKLSREGYNVEWEPNGENAVERVKELHPDLILLDLIMPGKNGFEVLREIRQNPENKDIKIIVASNLSQDVDIERAKEEGADEYFIKSNVSVAEMIEKVKHVLNS